VIYIYTRIKKYNNFLKIDKYMIVVMRIQIIKLKLWLNMFLVS